MAQANLIDYVYARINELRHEEQQARSKADDLRVRIAELERLVEANGEKPAKTTARAGRGAVEKAVYEHLADGRARTSDEIVAALSPTLLPSSIRSALGRMAADKRLQITNENYHVPEGHERGAAS